MAFNTPVFVVFFVVVLMLYALMPKRYKWIWLLAASWFFYLYASAKFFIFVLLSGASAWAGTLYIQRLHDRARQLRACDRSGEELKHMRERLKRRQKRMLISVLVLNFGILAVLKYFGFFCENLNQLLESFSLEARIPGFHLILPLGISFYTFQTISYVLDVYRGQVAAQKRYYKYLMYLSSYHQLVAGPIVRYSDVAAEIENRTVSAQDFSEGITRFCLGLTKKVVVANVAGSLAGNYLDADLASLSVAGAWFGVLLYTLQIYYDFSAYSDMAIGLGRMFGFHYHQNFNYPYIAKSVTEFWRRWHISLGSFFRDYVYIPLGGSRKGLGRTILNLFVVWALTGLWHGASWNFVLWGLYFFIFIALERLFLNKVFARLPGFVSHIYLLIVVYFGWILFRFKNMALIGVVLKGMFCQNGNPWTTFEANTTLLNYIFFLAIAVIAVTPLVHNIGRAISVASGRSAAWFRVNSVVQVAMPLVLLLISTMSLVGNSYNPFLYFQF